MNTGHSTVFKKRAKQNRIVNYNLPQHHQMKLVESARQLSDLAREKTKINTKQTELKVMKENCNKRLF